MTKLFVESFGQGPALVILHGWGMNSGMFRSFAQQLSENNRVYLVDLPGHGHSAALPAYSLNLVIEQLLETISEPAVWVGWSMGGSIVLKLSEDYPDQIQGMVLLCANPKYSTAEDWPLAMDNTMLEEFTEAVKENDQMTLAKFTGLMTQGEGKQSRELLRTVRKQLSEAPKPDRDALLWGLDILQNADFRPQFKSCQQPISVLLGADDPLIPEQVADYMQQLKPGVDITVIENSGHIPFLSQPHITAQLISDSLQQFGQR
ncbi:MAG: pimeloyl-ACP methyl ester esterase BioH [Gammaproteobacteria bacterium]|nr:pimeloyl-ACP methyl ester esterase BioH [Gammaproteobacteria bacterium]